jgi:hypothetical protein
VRGPTILHSGHLATLHLYIQGNRDETEYACTGVGLEVTHNPVRVHGGLRNQTLCLGKRKRNCVGQLILSITVHCGYRFYEAQLDRDKQHTIVCTNAR